MPINNMIGNKCIDNYQLAHQRESEGYKSTWYDTDNDSDGLQHQYTFTVDSSASSDIYFQVMTYAQGIIPMSCTKGVFQG